MRIKKDDTVVAISGRDAGTGRTGKVLAVYPARDAALVEGVNFVKRHTRKTQEQPQGDIVTREAPIRLCKLMLYCPQCKRGVRIGRRPLAGEDKAHGRECKRCGHGFDA